MLRVILPLFLVLALESAAAPYSLSSACRSELLTLCEYRTPFHPAAIRCLDAHRSELSPDCLSWHIARGDCSAQVNEAVEAKTQCDDTCRSYCGEGRSLLLCMRVLGSAIKKLTTKNCWGSDFARSVIRSLNS